jgi:PncC family amidohydrolase
MAAPIEELAARTLTARGLTLALAESCTGGLVAHRVTNVPGSSAFFLGGVVAYANQAKVDLLAVRPETLAAHGAVSEETAREMAQGARARFGADVALSVTGIAGPTGGTQEKPVGLVYVALAGPDAGRCLRHVWQTEEGATLGRLAIKERSAEAVLQLLVDFLQEVAPEEGIGEMVEFLDKAVGVEAVARRNGGVRPVAFVWEGRRYEVEAWGRERTVTRDGAEARCYLVQTAGPEAWELCRAVETGLWTMRRRWGVRYRGV